MDDAGYAAFKLFHHHAAKDAIGDGSFVDRGGPLGGELHGEKIPELPWRELLSNGIVQGGFATLITSLEALVMGRQVNALRVGFSVFEQDIWAFLPNWFREWLNEDDPNSKAYLYLKRADFLGELRRKDFFAEAFSLGYAEQDYEVFKDRFISYILRESYYGQQLSSNGSAVCAPVFLGRRLSFHFARANAELARGFLILTMKVSFDGQWEEEFQWLKTSVAKTENSFVLCKVSDILVRFGENKLAVEILEMAEKGTDEKRLIACPWARWQVLGEKGAALDYLEECIDSTDWNVDCQRLQTEGLLDLAKLYADLGGSDSYLARIYSACEANAQTFEKWERIITRYSIGGQVEDVSRCLKSAMDSSTYCFELCSLAEFLLNRFEDDSFFKKCAERAELSAKSVADWKDCAGLWQAYFEKAIRRCRVNTANASDGEFDDGR